MRRSIILVLMFLCSFNLQAQERTPLLEYGRGVPADVFWSPDGNTLAVQTQAKTLWLYDAHTLTDTAMLPDVTNAFYSPDGAWLLTADLENLWAIRPANAIETVIEDGFTSLYFSPDGVWLVARHGDLFSIRPADNPRQIQLDTLRDVKFSPDSRYVLTQSEEESYTLRGSTLTALKSYEFSPEMTSVQWLPDSVKFAVFTGGDRVDVFHVEDEATHSLTLSDRKRYQYVQWSLDGTRLMDYDITGNVRVWDIESGEMTLDLPSREEYVSPEENPEFQPRFYWYLAWSTDGSHIFRCSSAYETALYCNFYDAQTGEETGSADGESPNIDFNPNRRYFTVGNGLLDANTGEMVADFSPNQMYGFFRTWSRDNHRLAIASLWQPDIYIFSVEEMKVEHHFTPPPYFYSGSMKWSPDNRYLVTSGLGYGRNASGLITIWDAETGQEVGHITHHVLFGHLTDFNNNESTLVTSDALGNVAVFDLEAGRVSQTLNLHEERIDKLAWQPDGNLIATTTGRLTSLGNPMTPPINGNVVLITNALTGETVAALEHAGDIAALSWHPSGQFMVTDDNKGMYVWDTETLRQIPDLPGVFLASFQWDLNGDILMRRSYGCTHGGGDRIDIYSFVTFEYLTTATCTAGNNFYWVTEFEAILEVDLSCQEYVQNVGKDCVVQVLVISTHLPAREYLSLLSFEPDYTFGEYASEVDLLGSPDNTVVGILTENGVDVWKLGVENAELLWTMDDVSNVIWSHDSRKLIAVSMDGAHVVDVESGEVLHTLPEVYSEEINSILWRPDGAYVSLSDGENIHVFDAATGEQVLVLDGLESRNPRWFNRYLAVCRGDDWQCVQELWDVESRQMIASGDRVPRIISPDGRFGVETNTGVLRVWSLEE